MKALTVEQQYETYLKQITTRRQNPVKGATLAAYQCYWRVWIQPHIGSLKLSTIENGVMKGFVAVLAENNLKPSTIAGIFNCVQGIVASAMDKNGNALYPRKWNRDFIDAPILSAKDQKSPTVSREDVEAVISRTGGGFQALVCLAAGSGCRIGELLALKMEKSTESSYWDKEESKLVIQKTLWKGKEQSTKTAAGLREVDLDPALNAFLINTIGHKEGFMFQTKEGKPYFIRTLYDRAKEAGIPGYHAFRRFRVTHLENQGVPLGLIDFWVGHAGKGIHARYVKLDKDIESRKDWAKKAGLNFSLPNSEAGVIETNPDLDNPSDAPNDPHRTNTDSLVQ